MARIDYYFTTISPWAYLAGDRLERMAAEHGATITYRPVDLGALLPRSGGLPLPQRHPSRQEYRLQELDRQSRKLKMPITIRPAFWPANAAPSAYAIIAAQDAGGGDVGALVRGFLRAVWAEERNIAEDDTVRACLEAAGFDPDLADRGMLAGAETYARNLEKAAADGVFGAPFYVVDTGQKFWGQDRLEDLEAHLAGRL